MKDEKRPSPEFETDHTRAAEAAQVRERAGQDQPSRRKSLADQIDEMFTYHAPAGDQPTRYGILREAAKSFAHIVVANTPEGPDQTAAIRKLRECVMTANQAIALEGKL